MVFFWNGLFNYGADTARLLYTHVFYSYAYPTNITSRFKQLYGLLSRDNLIGSPTVVY